MAKGDPESLIGILSMWSFAHCSVAVKPEDSEGEKLVLTCASVTSVNG